MPNTPEELREEFEKAAEFVVIGESSDGDDDYNEYLGGIDPEAMDFIVNFWLAKLTQARLATIEEVKQAIPEGKDIYHSCAYNKDESMYGDGDAGFGFNDCRSQVLKALEALKNK